MFPNLPTLLFSLSSSLRTPCSLGSLGSPCSNAQNSSSLLISTLMVALYSTLLKRSFSLQIAHCSFSLFVAVALPCSLLLLFLLVPICHYSSLFPSHPIIPHHSLLLLLRDLILYSAFFGRVEIKDLHTSAFQTSFSFVICFVASSLLAFTS